MFFTCKNSKRKICIITKNRKVVNQNKNLSVNKIKDQYYKFLILKINFSLNKTYSNNFEMLLDTNFLNNSIFQQNEVFHESNFFTVPKSSNSLHFF